MIAALVAVIAVLILIATVRDHRSDDPRRRHPSTGGATRPDPWCQPSHVRMVRRHGGDR